jgi:hypothetical protein
MHGYQVLTIDGLGAMTAPMLARAKTAASQEGFKAGYDGQPRQKLALSGASPAQLQQLTAAYEDGYKRGAATRSKLPPSEASAGVPVDGNGVPGVDPPGDGPKGKGVGGPATVFCAQDTGKGGWREVDGRWGYAHHEGCILSALAARYLGDAGAWKQIWNGSKERGALPPGATPDRIPVRDPATGERVVFWMPDAAVERARELGCLPPAGVAGALSKMSTGTKLALVGAALVGGYLLVSNG